MQSGPKILIIDDEKPIREVLSASLRDENYRVESAEDGKSGLEKIFSFKPDIILLDIWMPGTMDGLDVLREAKGKNLKAEFIVMSGHGTIETAVKATKLGAWDFVEKPLSLDKIHILLNNILSFQREKSQKDTLLNKLRRNIAMVGDTAQMRDVKERIAGLSNKLQYVGVFGPIGVGKELLAENIHYFSERVGGAFVSMNCALLPEELMASEIFGFEKEAFSGAQAGRAGKLEYANQGSLLLKEAQLLSPQVLSALKEMLESGKFRRVKGTTDLEWGARLIFASTQSLEDLQAKDKTGFWALFQKANSFFLPSLSSRRDDIPALCDHFANYVSKENGYHKKEILPEAMQELMDYHWPVNIRELKNYIERLYLLVGGFEIDTNALALAGLKLDATGFAAQDSSDSLRAARIEFEKEFILKKLAENDGNVSKTAELIGVERSHLHRKIKSYGIDV